MYIQDVLESTTTELSMHQQAHQAASAVMHYIYKGNKPYADVEVGKYGDFYLYRSSDIGLDKSFALLIGLRQSNTHGMSGAIWKFDGGELLGYDVGVVVQCMQEFSLENLRQSVNSTGFMRVFEHEFMHLLDKERTNDRIVARARPDTRKPEYYNDPAENNAYFQDIASDLMHVINAGPEAGDYFELYGFTGNWKTDLSRLLTKHIYARRFVQSLRKQRRRSLMKRLYRLYQQMMQIVHHLPATSAQTQPPAAAQPASLATAA